METSQASIDGMYGKMAQDGWDTSGPLKWGFFFVAPTEDALKLVYSELADHDYRVESVHQNEGEDGDWTLFVSKVEVLPSDKLFRRCTAFNELAEAYDAIFDGWDVEQAG